MSCNHLNDCSRCGGLVDSLETEVMGLEKKVERLTSEREVILNALRKEAGAQVCNGTYASMLIGEALNRIADNIEGESNEQH